MKNIGFKLLYFITAIVIIINLTFSVKSSLFSDISDLPIGTLKESVGSPSGEKQMNIYIVDNPMGVAIRGEITQNGKSHNIFWQTDINEVEAVWVNDDIVLINEIPLDADDTFGYDCRRGYSLFDEGSLEQNFTNFRGANEQE